MGNLSLHGVLSRLLGWTLPCQQGLHIGRVTRRHAKEDASARGPRSRVLSQLTGKMNRPFVRAIQNYLERRLHLSGLYKNLECTCLESHKLIPGDKIQTKPIAKPFPGQRLVWSCASLLLDVFYFHNPSGLYTREKDWNILLSLRSWRD